MIWIYQLREQKPMPQKRSPKVGEAKIGKSSLDK